MKTDKKYTVAEAHKYFAIECNNRIWGLFDKADKSDKDIQLMINLAHASLLHWQESKGCKNANIQRGEYMLAMAYIHAGNGSQSAMHAMRCMEWTKSFLAEMEDFDIAYAHLCLARSLSLCKNTSESKRYADKALELGKNIAGKENKNYFMQDYLCEPWFGLKVCVD